MRLRRGAGAVALAAATLSVMAVPEAANAVAGTAGQFNMWQNDGYQGQVESHSSYDNDLHNDACSGCDPGPGGNFGDDMSSFVNRTSHYWLLYVDKNGYGDVYCVRPYSHDGDLGNNGVTNLEDEISSVYRFDDHTAGGSPIYLPPRCSDKGHTIGVAN